LLGWFLVYSKIQIKHFIIKLDELVYLCLKFKSMRLIYILCLSLFVTLYNCKDTNSSSLVNLEQKVKGNGVTVNDVSKQRYRDFSLDVKADKVAVNWKAYKEMVLITEHVKQANFSDFTVALDELQTLIEDLKKQTPTVLNTPSIYARIVVLETYLFKLHSLVNMQGAKKEELLVSIKAFLEAFSNLNFQINKKIERDSQRINKPL